MTPSKLLPLLTFAAMCGCDGQQYVSADTVALTITNDSTGIERVNRCHFVPVLLGNQVKARYRVEDEIRATIVIDRQNVTVTFDGTDEPVPPLEVSASRFEETTSELAESPPEGYTVELSSPCSPEE
jgi:hypothetical protein